MKVSTQGTGKYHIMAEINMIPLIDVALVLLIIFMVISPILVESQLRVDLPKVKTASNADEKAFKVEVAFDGTIAFEGKIIPQNNFRQILQRSIPPGHKASILIQADKKAPFEYVVYVMDIAKQLNVQKLGVSVLPEIVK